MCFRCGSEDYILISTCESSCPAFCVGCFEEYMIHEFKSGKFFKCIDRHCFRCGQVTKTVDHLLKSFRMYPSAVKIVTLADFGFALSIDHDIATEIFRKKIRKLVPIGSFVILKILASFYSSSSTARYEIPQNYPIIEAVTFYGGPVQLLTKCELIATRSVNLNPVEKAALTEQINFVREHLDEIVGNFQREISIRLEAMGITH